MEPTMKKTKLKQGRIIWTEPERTLVALAVREEMQVNQSKTLGPSMIMHCSQKVLGERGRSFPNPTDMNWMVGMLAAMNSGTLKTGQETSQGIEVPQSLLCLLERPIATLDVSMAIKRRLIDATLQTIGDLVLSTDKDILGVKFLGTSHLTQIKEALSWLGLTTGMIKAEEPQRENNPPVPSVKVVDAEDTATTFVKHMLSEVESNMIAFAEHFTLASLETMRITVNESLEILKEQMMQDQIASIQKSVQVAAGKYMSQAGFKVDLSKIPTKKIVIVGPRDTTAAELRKMYDKRCKKLFIWDGSQAMSLLEDNLKFADHVILQTGMVPHSANDKVRDVYKAEPIIIGKTGGNSELHKVMDALLT